MYLAGDILLVGDSLALTASLVHSFIYEVSISYNYSSATTGALPLLTYYSLLDIFLFQKKI